MRIIIILFLAALTAAAQPYSVNTTGLTRQQARASWSTINSNTVWLSQFSQNRNVISPIYANSNFTVSANQAASMKMSNIVFVVDTTASNITLTMPQSFENTFSVLNRGTNWVTMQASEGTKFLLAPMDGTVSYSDTLVNKYVMKVHTLFHINATNIVVQSEFRPLPNVVFNVTNNIPPSGSGTAQTNISVAGVTNAGTAAYSNSSAFYLASNPSGYVDGTGHQPLDADLTSWAAIAPATKEPAITSGTTAQYWRGDKSWQTLDKTAVGLANVDNVVDASKPVSSAQESRILGATNGIVVAYNAADVIVTNGLSARIIATNDILVTRITDATNSANTVELARIVSATNNLDAAKVTVGNLSVNRLNGGTLASSSTFWRGDGTWAAAGGGSSYRTKLEMTTNFVNAHGVANTLTNIPQLSFAVVSGTTYKYEAVIYFTTAATTTGSRWCLTGPAMTGFMGTSEYTLTAATSTRNAMNQGTSLPAAANLTSAAGANMAVLTGIFRPSASGTVSIAFASEVLSSAVTAQAGSTLEYW